METAREKVKLGEWKLRKYTNRKSKVWESFAEIIKDDEQSAGFVMCRLCHVYRAGISFVLSMLPSSCSVCLLEWVFVQHIYFDGLKWDTRYQTMSRPYPLSRSVRLHERVGCHIWWSTIVASFIHSFMWRSCLLQYYCRLYLYCSLFFYVGQSQLVNINIGLQTMPSYKFNT